MSYKRPAAVHTPRTDELPPPAVGTTWSWKVQRVGGDGAESGPNAVIKAFSLKKDEYVRINCSVHVQRADTQGKYAHYNEADNAEAVNAFVEQLKNHAVTRAHVQVGKRLVHEWLKQKKEDAAAAYFQSTIMPLNFTYAEANLPLDCEDEDLQVGETAVVGGVPPTSNALEARNGAQKKALGHKREAACQFLISMRKELENHSASDLSFGKVMPTGYTKTLPSGVKISKEVWTTNFWGAVMAEHRSKHGLHELYWLYSNHEDGAVIMMSRAGREELYADANVIAMLRGVRSEGERLKILRKAVQDGKPSWLQTFKALMSNTSQVVADQKMDFQAYVKWLKAFHVVKPIRHAKFEASLVTRLQNSNLRLDLSKLGKQCPITKGKNTICFMQCSCEDYRHYLWCLHSALWMVATGLIAGPPPNLDPTQIASVKCLPCGARKPISHVGRPAKAKAGAPLQLQ